MLIPVTLNFVALQTAVFDVDKIIFAFMAILNLMVHCLNIQVLHTMFSFVVCLQFAITTLVY